MVSCISDIQGARLMFKLYRLPIKKIRNSIWAEKGNNYRELTWGALDDVVMGGVSESTFLINPNGSENGGPTGLFKGVVSTANNGGFTSIRTKNLSTPEDLSAYDGIELRLKGDGCRYKLILRTSGDWDTVGYTAGFNTVKDQWQTVSITMVLSIFLWPNQESLARWFELPGFTLTRGTREPDFSTFRDLRQIRNNEGGA